MQATGITSADVKRQAAALGFDLCGVAPAEALPELAFFGAWLARGYAGELERTASRRADVRAVMPSARAVIRLGTVYNTAAPYSSEEPDPARAALARYAWGDDYHVVFEQRLAALIAEGADHDSAPRRHRTPRVRLRHLPGGLPLEPVARHGRLVRAGLGRAPGPRRPAPARPLAPIGRRAASAVEGERDEARRREAAAAQPAVAIGNRGDPEGAAALRACREETAADSLVAEHVAWAVEKLDAG
jgi:epoxyqueuosine reductase QueG